tara:strand:- start:573 stop:686 length:114 start_codon:yes stop_codon:yes gene_type:complete
MKKSKYMRRGGKIGTKTSKYRKRGGAKKKVMRRKRRK